VVVANVWGVTVLPPDKGTHVGAHVETDRHANGTAAPTSRACVMELENLRPPIVPRDLHGGSWEEIATKHLIEWLPEQKTTCSRSAFEFTGTHMCPPVTFGTAKRAVRSRVLWFTAITAAEKDAAHTARSENYLSGVRAMVLSALKNSPSLVPVVIYLGGHREDCFVQWLTARGAYVMVVDRLSFMASLPDHATDHSSASMANHGAFAILDTPRFWLQVQRMPLCRRPLSLSGAGPPVCRPSLSRAAAGFMGGCSWLSGGWCWC
jgi:hypothetical protein